ncbi:MAG: class I adenylate cyclase [Spirochaetes bacterium]|nr:class I adenylate cyclase [Spirochaetota bacterium]
MQTIWYFGLFMSFLDTIGKNTESFLRFNEEKLRRFQSLITNTNIKRVINTIPLLLSVNDKRLPGYVEGDVPVGICSYTPDDETVKYLRGRFHQQNIPVNLKNPFVEMLAVMGSVGTIAYTKDSDFDYWVLIDSRNCTKAMLDRFCKKVETVQEWAKAEIKTDVHLFVNDVEKIRHNIFADEEQAFGSTIGAVLKDEFLRSSTIIAGKVPFWWVIPRFVTDREYDELFGRIPEEMKQKLYVDMGNLYEISKEDFLGAALFQLIKSLGNPFKSILKIGVLEKYLFGTGETTLLCQKVKMNILSGNLDNRILDSYILMFEEVYDFYESFIEEKQLLKILRQNLYLKINPQLSKYVTLKNNQNLPYKVSVMFTYVKKWGWGLNDIKNLDNFDNWDYSSIMSFWNQVKKFMLLSYQKIAKELPALNFARKIPESDFMLLSRKIKTNFSSEPNKIDNYITFKDIPYESILYIEPTNKSIDDHEWRIYKRDTSSDEKFVTTTLRVENSLVKLLAWSAINEIFNPQFSRVKMQSGYVRINQNQVVEILTTIANLFSLKGAPHTNEYLLQPAFSVANIILLNFNLENEDQIKTIHHIYKTSWGESFMEIQLSYEGIVQILSRLLQDALKLRLPYESCCAVNSPESFRKQYKEVETLFRESYEFIVTEKALASHRVIATLKDYYITVLKSGAKISVQIFQDHLAMISNISMCSQKEVRHRFIGDGSGVMILAELYRIKRPNSFLLVQEERKGAVIIYCINELGNLFSFIRPQPIAEEVLMYCYGACVSAMRKVNTAAGINRIRDEISVYRLTIDRFDNRELENQTRWCEEIYVLKYKSKVQLRAVIESGEGGKKKYSIVFPNNSRSEFLEIEKLPILLKKLRQKGAAVPRCISDIEFKNRKPQDSDLGSTPYLLEKYRLELLIENSLR